MELATTAPVLVTGGSGFIAGHLVNQLLQRGYKVRTTVRSKEHSSYDHLLKLPNAEKNLEVVEADLTKQSTWEAAFSGGVEYVFHVASPHILKPDDPENTLMLPSVGGTQNILEMCQRTESVKKLIYTSCMSAVSDDFDNSREYDESDWNTMSSLTRNSYAYSKALAEMGVINYTTRPECRFKVATLLPGVVLGPALCNRLSFSHKFILGFLNKQIRGNQAHGV
jgi:nucleoside-diphosphate-sugar epimerase